MTVTNQIVSPISSGKTPGGLEQAAGVLSEDWVGGITFTSDCVGAGRWGCTHSDTKTVAASPGAVSFDPFIIWSSSECFGLFDEAYESSIARSRLERGRSAQLAAELVESHAHVTNPDLKNNSTNVTPGSAVDMAEALQLLVSSLAPGGEAWIHIPHSLLAEAIDAGVKWNGSGYEFGAYKVIVDAYPNKGPIATPQGRTWIYLTGPVEVAHASSVEIQTIHHQANRVVTLAEELAILRFDPCKAFSVLVN